MPGRRAVLRVLGAGALVGSGAVGEARTRVFHVGVLSNGSAPALAREVDALRAGLRDHGYVEGKNIVIEYRWAEGKLDRLPDLAAELVRLKVDVIVTYAGTVTRAAKQATSVIPIVIAAAGDPIASGLVSNLARPEGNVTGSTFFAAELAAKRLELLREASPRLQRVGVVVNPETGARRIFLPGMLAVARSLRLEIQEFEIRDPSELEHVFAAMDMSRVDGVVINEDTMLNTHARAIGTLAGRQRFPSIGFIQIADAGGLMGYGADIPEMFRRAAYFIDRLLKGGKPGDLPIERATRFEMVINLNTARALDLAVPPSILLRATKVIGG